MDLTVLYYRRFVLRPGVPFISAPDYVLRIPLAHLRDHTIAQKRQQQYR
jgi:hypothetical protein